MTPEQYAKVQKIRARNWEIKRIRGIVATARSVDMFSEVERNIIIGTCDEALKRADAKTTQEHRDAMMAEVFANRNKKFGSIPF